VTDRPGRAPKRRRAITRPLLLEGASRAIAKHGYAGASVEVICAEAGFTRGAFYSNFQSKDELGIVLYEDRANRLIEALRSGAADVDDDRDIVDRIFSAAADPTELILSTEFELAALHNPELMARVRSFNDGMVAEIAAIVPRLVERAGHPPVSDPVAAARSLVALFRGLAAQALLNSATAPQQSDAKTLVSAVLSAYSR
jgi:AcrR family transcriptional regulator